LLVELDLDPAQHVELRIEGRPVLAGAAVEQVAHVVPRVDQVVSGATEELRQAAATRDERVGAGAAVDAAGAGADQLVVAGAADQDVIAGAHERVVSAAAAD